MLAVHCHASAQELPASSADNPTVDVATFEVRGNSLLEPQRLDALLASRTGKLSWAGIEAAAQALQAAYREAGFGAVVVQIPQQTLRDGRVVLEVVEGRLSQIQVAGNNRFTRDNVLRSLPALRMAQTPQLGELDGELLMANENPAKTSRVVFQPGERRGQVEALVVLEEAPVERWQISMDNTGNDATGKYRLALGYQHANLMDSDSVLNVRFVTSPTELSSVAVLNSSLRVPLYASKTFLEWSALVSNTQSIPSQTAAGELRFTGKGVSFGARALRLLPSLGEYKHQVSAGVERRRYINDCSLGVFGAAGCGTAAASVDVLPLTLAYVVQKPGAVLASLQWIQNLAVGSAGRTPDFNAARPGADARYRLMRGSAVGGGSIDPRWSFGWQVNAQYSLSPLVPAEQWGIGGQASVRGYPERVVAGDSGMNAGFEIRRVISDAGPSREGGASASITAFVEAGAVANRLGTSCDVGRARCDIAGAGAGLLLQPAKGTSARIDVARAGKRIAQVPRGDWRLHFTVSHTF